MKKGLLGLFLGVLLVVGWMVIQGRDDPGRDPQGSEALMPSLQASTETKTEAGRLPDSESAREPSSALGSKQNPLPMAPTVEAITPTQGIFGRVSQEGGEPVGRCKVSLSIIARGIHAPMEGAWTGEDGQYACSFSLRELAKLGLDAQLEAASEWRKYISETSRRQLSKEESAVYLSQVREGAEVLAQPLWLEVSVENAKGFRAFKRVELQPDLPDPMRVDLSILKQHSLEGIVSTAGGALPFADVCLLGEEGDLLATALTNAEGRYRMPMPPAGSFRVHARKVGHGAAQSADVSAGRSIQAPEHGLLIGGDATLRGVVKTPAGAAVHTLPLIVIDSALAETIRPPFSPSDVELANSERLGGLAYSDSVTDKEGRFSIPALQFGHYVIRYDGLSEGFQPEGTFETDQEHVITFSGNLLTVLLTGDDADLARLRVHCIQEDWVKNGALGPIAHYAQPAMFGRTQFVLEPGTQWVVFAELDGRRTSDKSVRFSAKGQQKELSIKVRPSSMRLPDQRRADLPAAHGTGAIKVEVTDHAGKPQGARITLWRKSGAGSILALTSKEIPEDGTLRGLEPGLYEYLVESASSTAPFLSLRGKGFETISPGRTNELNLLAESGGHLSLHFAASSLYEGLHVSAIASPIEPSDGSLALRFLMMRAPGTSTATFTLEEEGGTVICSPALAPGKYSISFSCSNKDVAIEAQLFEIESGTPTTLELRLDESQ
ncbi:MAG: hypothetical protein ACI9F9_000407 [Candidatus Paceibacteria bacterium]|jgi:hypothetical protein